jgi:hypothetical protein
LSSSCSQSHAQTAFSNQCAAGGGDVLNVQRTVKQLITVFTLQEQNPSLLVCKHT